MLPASHPVCAIPSSSQSNKPLRLSKAPTGFWGAAQRAAHPAWSQLPGSFLGALGITWYQGGRSRSALQLQHPTPPWTHKTLHKWKTELCPESYPSNRILGRWIYPLWGWSAGRQQRSREVWDQVEEDFVLSWEEEFCVFLTHLPLSFPWKTSTLSTAPVPNPEEPFWQPGAAGKAAPDTSQLPTLQPTESHRRGEQGKSLSILFPLLKTFCPPSVTTSPCPQERCPTHTSRT